MKKRVLVTGGAGFIGSNLVRSFLQDGHPVTVLDALLRPGSEHNLEWLRAARGPGELTFLPTDVRDADAVRAAVAGADVIYHLAAQVAVTTSVQDPQNDFEINAAGTANVLEAARRSARRPILVYTSTNKVYGGLEDVAVTEGPTRYEFTDLPLGVPETQPLDFHSPYGCSKGAADQYVRDYARIYDLRTVVFRMSCIYGPRQFGNEDQGWLAHFIIAALTGEPITIYGNGKQTRDVLHVADLIRALRLAVEKIDQTRGEVFNIGGGPSNALSVWKEFEELLAELRGERTPAQYGPWRPGDQPCYVSDIRKAERVLGWRPQFDTKSGISDLWDWVSSQRRLFDRGPSRATRRSGRALAGSPIKGP